MGFLGTIPAEKLSALYDTAKRVLILYAEGEVMGLTYELNFHQDTWLGCLKFTLQAWSGPLTGKNQQYTHHQSFSIDLPSPVYPSENVIIVTANHPEGVPVPIHYTGILPPGNLSIKPASDAETKTVAENDTVAETTPGHTQLNVLFKTKFNIRANAIVPAQGSVTITYDSKYVKQTSAGIHDTDIMWTFLATEMGNTQITITTAGGIAQFITRHTYDVRIFVF